MCLQVEDQFSLQTSDVFKLRGGVWREGGRKVRKGGREGFLKPGLSHLSPVD